MPVYNPPIIPSTYGHDITGMTQGIITVGTGALQFTSNACKRVDLSSQSLNTAKIYVGSADTIAGNGTSGGIELLPGDFYSLDIDNTDKIWVEAGAVSQKLSFIFYT